MAFSKTQRNAIYSDFSGGFNDSVAAISIGDNEVCISENADYSAEVKSFKTRKGCTKVNSSSFGAEVTDAYVWSIGSVEKKILVINGKVYDFDPEESPALTEKISLTSGKKNIYPFVVFNKLYFGDGAELYEWGGFDHASEESEDGTYITITTGQIVKNTTSAGGTLGHFYQAKNDRGSINLGAEIYSNTSNWDDVTEVEYFASSVCRVFPSYDPSVPEIVKISVYSGASAAGTITIYLDGTAYSCSVSSGDSVDQICNKLTTMSLGSPAVWTAARDGNAVNFTKNSTGICSNGYADPASTGVTLAYTTTQEGTINDNNLAPIKKCTMFIVHSLSYRVFACGNPDDNALFYSEMGSPNYFKGDVNKVYALNSYGKPTGLTQLSECILVSYEMGWYSWSGVEVLDDAEWKPLNIPYGCVANDTIVLTPYSFMFLGTDGIYNVSASIMNKEIYMLQGSDVISKISRSRVDNCISSIYDKSKCKAVFHNNTYYLAYGTTSSGGNDNVLKFEWDTKSFTKVTGWKVNCWIKDHEGLYFGSKNYLLMANSGYSDINVNTGAKKAIELYIKTKEYGLGNAFITKVCNVLGFVFKQDSAMSTQTKASISVITGYDTYDISDAINISESLVYGRNWGLNWGFREAITKMVELNLASNTFQIEIKSSELDSPVTLVAIGFVYSLTDYITPNILKDEVLLK